MSLPATPSPAGASGTDRIGIIGLGLMRTALAERLLEHGCAVVVWNRTREKATALLVRGAVWSANPCVPPDTRCTRPFRVALHGQMRRVEELPVAPVGYFPKVEGKWEIADQEDKGLGGGSASHKQPSGDRLVGAIGGNSGSAVALDGAPAAFQP